MLSDCSTLASPQENEKASLRKKNSVLARFADRLPSEEDEIFSSELDFESPQKKNKDLYFVNVFGLMKCSFSSSQIEGKCLRKLSDVKDEEKSKDIGLLRGLNHFGTHEELPQIFGPIKEELETIKDSKQNFFNCFELIVKDNAMNDSELSGEDSETVLQDTKVC